MTRDEALAVLLEHDPEAAAAYMERMAEDLKAKAAAVRAHAAENPWKNPGGMCDRVTISVIGPDGVEKQRVCTHPQES